MLLSALAENLLTLLSYDTERASIIRGTVDPSLFGGIHRLFVARIYDHIDRYKSPPQDHLPDLFSDKIEGVNQREATLYTDIIESIHTAKDNINAEYVMSQLETFIRRQSLRSVAIELAKELQRDTEDSLDKADALIASVGKTNLSVFDPGTRLSDKKRALKFLDTSIAAFPTGIPDLDKRGFGPVRKELWLGIGNTGAGKTWLLIQLAKMALVHRHNVLHVTLEQSEERATQRYMQALFSISKRNESLLISKFKRDDLGRPNGLDEIRIKPSFALDDPNIRRKLESRIDKFGHRLLHNIFVKEFPTGALTLGHLQAYIDNLEASERFTPDIIVVDYPDLMRLDADNYRLAVDTVYKGLRGLAVSRNAAMVVVSQSHRSAAKAKLVGADNVAEAYSKIAHADTVVTYSQSKHEHQLGLARLHVAKGRNDSDKITIVITQQYGVGGFVMDSALMWKDYWNSVPKEGDEE